MRNDDGRLAAPALRAMGPGREGGSVTAVMAG